MMCTGKFAVELAGGMSQGCERASARQVRLQVLLLHVACVALFIPAHICSLWLGEGKKAVFCFWGCS